MSDFEVPERIKALAEAIDDVIEGCAFADILNALAHVSAICLVQSADTMADATEGAAEFAQAVLQTVKVNAEQLGGGAHCDCSAKPVIQ